MRHLTLGIHYPKKEHIQDILDVAEKVNTVAKTCEGYVEAGSWLDEENNRIIMLSLWESAELAMEAAKKLRPIISEAPLSDWERKPSDNILKLQKLV